MNALAREVRNVQIVIAMAGLAVVAGTVMYLVGRHWHERETAALEAQAQRYGEEREKAVQRVLLALEETRPTLGLVETWGDDWKAETIHAPGMAWGDFESLHDFHERVAKP